MKNNFKIFILLIVLIGSLFIIGCGNDDGNSSGGVLSNIINASSTGAVSSGTVRFVILDSRSKQNITDVLVTVGSKVGSSVAGQNYYQATDVSMGDQNVKVQKVGYATYEATYKVVPGTQIYTINLTPIDKASINGIVTNGITGQPIQNALISAGVSDNNYTATTYTDEAGRYSLENIPITSTSTAPATTITYSIRAVKEGFETNTVATSSSGIGGGGQIEANISLVPKDVLNILSPNSGTFLSYNYSEVSQKSTTVPVTILWYDKNGTNKAYPFYVKIYSHAQPSKIAGERFSPNLTGPNGQTTINVLLDGDIAVGWYDVEVKMVNSLPYDTTSSAVATTVVSGAIHIQ